MITRRLLRQALPFLSLLIVLLATFYVQPRAMSYFGLNLMLQYAIPIALATIAQMFVITVNDLDLSIGPFVGLVGCIGATLLYEQPVLGILVLLLLVAVYGAVGALIHLRNLPSIVVTLGLSFVWLGIAVLILPSPGGKAPDWLKAIMGLQLPVVPFPIVAAVVIGLVVHVALMTSSYGVIARGAGGNPKALTRAGWSMLRTKVMMYMMAGVFGVLSGLSLLGLTTSADAHVADRYTLYSIAGVILCSAKKTFFAGAELKDVLQFKEGDGPQVFAWVEGTKKLFRRLEKDTNSGLNDLNTKPRRDYLAVANAYRQDWPWLGFTSQAI